MGLCRLHMKAIFVKHIKTRTFLHIQPRIDIKCLNLLTVWTTVNHSLPINHKNITYLIRAKPGCLVRGGEMSRCCTSH